jgi:hypothetical protein
MPGLFSKLRKGISGTANVVLFPGDATRTNRNLKRARNLVGVLIISAILWYITRVTGLEANIRAPLAWIRPYWLVLIFWISILASVATREIIYLLRSDPAEQMFPEIQRAWDHACKAMTEIGVQPSDLPIFLVLSLRKPDGAFLFDSQQLRLRNIRVPDEISQPFHVDVSDTAIFVVCDQVSLTGTLTGRLIQNLEKRNLAITGVAGVSNSMITSSVLGLTHSSQNETGKENGMAALLSDEVTPAVSSANDSEILITSQDELEEMTRKLGFLCTLISRTRKPYCAVNGILVVLPISIDESEKLTSHAIEMASIDMSVIRESTGIDLSFAVLGTHLETLPGFDLVLSRVEESIKSRYLGLALPTRFDVTPAEWSGQILKTLRWYERSVLTALFLKSIFQMDPEDVKPGETGRNCMIRENHQIFRFMQSLGRSWNVLSKTCLRLGEAHIKANESNPRLAGLFLTGLDHQGAGPHVFMRDMVKHLVNQQSSVAWTPQALARDRRLRQIAAIIKGAVFIISVLIFLYAYGNL